MSLQQLINRLNELKKSCELEAHEVQVQVRLTDDVIDRFADDENIKEVKEELRNINYYPWKDEHIDIDLYEGICADTGNLKLFETVVIQGDQ